MTASTEYELFNPIDMLQFITHQTLRFGIVEGAVAALKGGCKWIQLRMKEAPLDEVERTARELIPLC